MKSSTILLNFKKRINLFFAIMLLIAFAYPHMVYACEETCCGYFCFYGSCGKCQTCSIFGCQDDTNCPGCKTTTTTTIKTTTTMKRCGDECYSKYPGKVVEYSCNNLPPVTYTCTMDDYKATWGTIYGTECDNYNYPCLCKYRVEYCPNGCDTSTGVCKTTTTTIKTTTTTIKSTTTTYYYSTTTTTSSSHQHYYTCNTGPKAGQQFHYTDCDMSHIYPGSAYKVEDIDPSCVCRYQECNDLLTQGYIRGGKVPGYSFGKEKWCQESCETLCKKYWGSQYEGFTCCGCQGSNPIHILFGYNDEESGIWQSPQSGFCPEGNEDCYCKVRDATSCYLAITREGLCELKDSSGKPVPVSGSGGTCYCDTDCCSRGDCCTDVELHCGHICGTTTTTIKTSTTTPTTYYSSTTTYKTTTTAGSVTTTVTSLSCVGNCDKCIVERGCCCDMYCVGAGDCCPDACSVCGRCPGSTTTIKSSTTVKTTTTSTITGTTSCKPRACWTGNGVSYSLHTPGTITSGENKGKAYWSGNCPYQSYDKCANGCNSVTGECKASTSTTIKTTTTTSGTSSCRPRECSGGTYSLHTPGTIQQGPDAGKAYKIGNCIYGSYEKCANGCDSATGACRTATTTTLRPISECPQSSCYSSNYRVYNPGFITEGIHAGKSFKANSCPYQSYEECANGCNYATGLCK